MSGASSSRTIEKNFHARFSALLLKVQAAIERNEPSSARLDLDCTGQLWASLPPNRKAFWTWWSGRVESASMNFEASKEILSSLLESDSGALEAGDRFLIFLDLAEALKSLKDFETLKAEAKKLQKWLPLLDVSPFSRAIILGFAQIVQQRWPEDDELSAARDAMGKGAAGAPSTFQNSPKPQPFGRGIGPNSVPSPQDSGTPKNVETNDWITEASQVPESSAGLAQTP